jgi:hypothetical protein
MAKGRSRGPTRLDKRREAEAVEAKEAQSQEEGQEEEVEEEAEEEADAEPDAETDSDDGDGESPKKKKPAKKKAVKKAPAAKKPATKRSRAAKEVRRRAVWVVYDNASKEIETFPFNQKAEAEALLAKKIEEKKTTFYLNLVKKAIEE